MFNGEYCEDCEHYYWADREEDDGDFACSHYEKWIEEIEDCEYQNEEETP
jgi:hypothetical protein